MQAGIPNQAATTVGEQHRETNTRLYARNIPSQPLQPYLDLRPRNSKYTLLPIVEPHVLEHAVQLKSYPTYSVRNTFNPGNTESPWSGYAAAVNIESDLKGQIFALQKCSQATWVPKSTSDLYQYGFVTQTPFAGNDADKHALLFQDAVSGSGAKYAEFNPNPAPDIVGIQWIGNATRVQMQDVPGNRCVNGFTNGSNMSGQSQR